MASEDGRLPEKQPDGANEYGNTTQVKEEAVAAVADPDPARRSDSSADSKYNQWSRGIKNALRKTQVTDWLIVLFTRHSPDSRVQRGHGLPVEAPWQRVS